MIENCLSEFEQDDLTAKQSDYAVFLPAISSFYANYVGRQRTENSGIAEYNYILPAQTK